MPRRPIRPTIHPSRDATDPGGGLTPDRFREALSNWASGVAIVAATDGDEVDAITVTAFAPLSIDPPLVLVCIGENASILPMILEEQRFTVNLLSAEARRIASVVADWMPPGTIPLATEGDPVLEGALTSFVCRLAGEYPGGDHRVVVGEVERVALGPDTGPLVYFRREYGRFQKQLPGPKSQP